MTDIKPAYERYTPQYKTVSTSNMLRDVLAFLGETSSPIKEVNYESKYIKVCCFLIRESDPSINTVKVPSEAEDDHAGPVNDKLKKSTTTHTLTWLSMQDPAIFPRQPWLPVRTIRSLPRRRAPSAVPICTFCASIM